MSFDGIAEQDAVLARVVSNVALCAGRAFDDIPEEQVLPRDTLGIAILPYVVVSFGTLVETGRDQSIEGAEQQPLLMPIIWECWAATKRDARLLASQVRVAFRGWQPDADNATEIRLSGGGWSDYRGSQARPTRCLETVTGETTLNMSVEVS